MPLRGTMIAGAVPPRVHSGAGVRNAELIEPRDRGGDRRLAVVHVVGDADGGDAGGAQRFARDDRGGEEAFVLERVTARRDRTGSIPGC